ncbi:nuclear transport factor 2 family protein [Duganella sp. Dugasp56]|uniref:nuclear transport factor 2 family protein n=1 Tax=Duganella sp. Dugasp56 TaxID=3243046 RepID=UPI0039B04A78
MTQEPAAPGVAWMAIIRRPTLDDFAAAFTADVVLETSAGDGAVRGAAAIRRFFDATRAMYDGIAFVHETSAASRTVLEWEGVFRGAPIAGATILAYDGEGRIAGIHLYQRPCSQVAAFSSELAARLQGRAGTGIFTR